MNQARILIVDDERGVVHSCVRILELQGYSVLGKTESESVPELLKQQSFDLLLSDIRMPKIDGLELLKIAKEIDPNLSVILITGYGTMEDAIKAMRLGAQGFIMKPFEPDDLVAAIEESLKRRALLRDSARLQTLLPLLEINKILQVSEGEATLVKRVLEVAHRQTKAARLAWLIYQSPDQSSFPKLEAVETCIIPEEKSVSRIPSTAIDLAIEKAIPIGVLVEGTLLEQIEGQPNIIGLVLPLIIKGEIFGLLTAETGELSHSGPFNPLSLDLLLVLATQLAITLENVKLYQEGQALHTFNDNVIKTVTNGLIVIDENSRITTFNPAAAIMLGQDKEQVLNKPIDEALNDADALIHLFQKTIETNQLQAQREVDVQHWDGTTLPISVSIAPMSGENENKAIGAVGIFEDLSEIKALEAERRRLDRLAALGEMSAVVAHEIRNPMAGIAAGVEYIARKMPKDSPDYEGAGMILGEIERVNRILEDILFVARPLQLSVSEAYIPEIIDTVIQRCQSQINESNLKIISHYGSNIPMMPVDRQRLEQVFSNLIINATQAMNREVLKIDVSGVSQKNESNPEYTVITLEDTGPGIPLDIRAHIFEPFFTTKTRGTGLGLTVARRIIEEHKGSIVMESEQNQGTRFIITLPVFTEKT